MLVLGRKPGQSIVIGTGKNAVTVVVRRVAGNVVKIGVKAPRDIPVRRDDAKVKTRKN